MPSHDSAWTRRATRLVLDRWPWLRVHEDDVELPNGRRLDGFLRVEGRDHAEIFAITADQRVVLVRQYKPGPQRVVLQVPAGYLEADETAEACARRELLEETGYAATAWEHLGSYGVDGNRGFGTAHLFLARDVEFQQPADPGDDEDLELLQVPLAQVPALLTSGEISEVGPVACVALALIRLLGLADASRG